MTAVAFEKISAPACIVVLTSRDCPNCARVVEQVRHLDQHCGWVESSILDVFDAEAIRKKHGVISVPATILDDDLVIQGQVTARGLAEILAARGTPAYDTIKLRSLLEMHKVEKAAQLLSEPGKALAVLPILVTGELSDRMGATLVIQTAHEIEPGCLSDLVPGLIPLLSSENRSLRGDVADLLGTLEDPRALPALIDLENDEDEDVVSAVTDSINAIRRKMN